MDILRIMCADIYRTGNPKTFLLVPRGATLGVVPKEILGGLGNPVFLSSRELDDPQLSVDTTGIGSELLSKGFFVRRA